MSNAKPPRNLTPVLCQRLSKEMLKACQDVAAEHGLVAEAKEMAAIDLRRGSISHSGCRSLFRKEPRLTRKGFTLRRWRKPLDCLSPIMADTSAPAVRPSGLSASTPAGQILNLGRTHPGWSGVQVHGGQGGAAIAKGDA